MTPHFFGPRPHLVRILVSNTNSPSRRSFDNCLVVCSRLYPVFRQKAARSMSPQIRERAATFLIHPFKRARHVATWPRRRPRQRRTLLVSSRHEGRPHRSEKLGIFLDSRQSEAKFVASYFDSLAPKSLRGLVSDQLINPRFVLDWWLGVRWAYGSPPRSRGWEPGSCAAHGATYVVDSVPMGSSWPCKSCLCF